MCVCVVTLLDFNLQLHIYSCEVNPYQKKNKKYKQELQFKKNINIYSFCIVGPWSDYPTPSLSLTALLIFIEMTVCFPNCVY